MTVSLSNIPKETNIYRFITSGKPGNCKFCRNFVEKLEAHHICYSPQITINLCHNCHHKTHFWPQRLDLKDITQMLKLRFHHNTALKLLKSHNQNPKELYKLFAPSKSKFLKKRQELNIKRIGPKHEKAYTPKYILEHKGVNKLKKAHKKIGEKGRVM